MWIWPDSDSEPQLFSDIWPLTLSAPPLSDGDADHNLEAGSDSVEGRRIVNISYLASHIIRKQLNVLVVEKVASASIVSKLSQSGIGLAHLELALKRDSVNGIKLLLKEPNGAFKYRITNNNMAIAKITSYIQKRQTSIQKWFHIAQTWSVIMLTYCITRPAYGVCQNEIVWYMYNKHCVGLGTYVH